MLDWRREYALAYDSVRGRTVLFGGSTGQLHADTWEHDGRRWHRASTSTNPPPRHHHCLAHDSARQRIVLFGGSDGRSYLDDTWEYDGSDWRQVSPAASPPPRAGCGVAYDSARQVTVLFGGLGLGTRFSDTWEYDGTNWSQIATAASPSPRSHLQIAYDESRRRTILFGGAIWSGSTTVAFGDTWEFDGINWTPVISATGPMARSHHGLAYDSTRGRLVLFGGRAFNSIVFDDTWILDASGWQIVPQTLSPPGTFDLLSYDRAHDRMRRFNVASGNSTTSWEFDGTVWTQTRSSLSPPARTEHKVAFDSAVGALVLFGGRGTSQPLFPDTWLRIDDQWIQVQPSVSPPGRRLHAMAYDIRNRRTIVHGGMDAFDTPLADTWAFDGSRWSQVTGPSSPGVRYGHAVAFDSRRGRLVLFGGAGVGGRRSDTWELEGSTWMQRPGSGPPLRALHAMAYDSARGVTVLFGGSGGTGLPLADTWEYDGSAWNAVTTVSAPSPRSTHTLAFAVDRGRTVLFGGQVSNGSHLGDTWEYDGASWTQLSTLHAPDPRTGTSLAYDSIRRCVVMHGGLPAGSLVYHYPVHDTWELTGPESPTWTSHGQGCASSAGMPVLDVPGGATPQLGSTFPLRCTGLPPLPGTVLLLFGIDGARWNGTPLPVALDPLGLPGCQLWIAPQPGSHAVLLHGGGSIVHDLPLPPNPGFAGMHLAVQALVLDPFAANGIGGVTNAGLARPF